MKGLGLRGFGVYRTVVGARRLRVCCRDWGSGIEGTSHLGLRGFMV